jgi:hypothetical protein
MLQFACKPIVMSLTGAQRQRYRKTIAIYERMNLAGQPAP